jgi:hypothetical protein
LKLSYGKSLSNFAFNLNLRRYNQASSFFAQDAAAVAAAAARAEGEPGGLQWAVKIWYGLTDIARHVMGWNVTQGARAHNALDDVPRNICSP